MSSRGERKARQFSENSRGPFQISRERDIYACPVRRSASRSPQPDEGSMLMPHAECLVSSGLLPGDSVRLMDRVQAHS